MEYFKDKFRLRESLELCRMWEKNFCCGKLSDWRRGKEGGTRDGSDWDLRTLWKKDLWGEEWYNESGAESMNSSGKWVQKALPHLKRCQFGGETWIKTIHSNIAPFLSYHRYMSVWSLANKIKQIIVCQSRFANNPVLSWSQTPPLPSLCLLCPDQDVEGLPQDHLAPPLLSTRKVGGLRPELMSCLSSWRVESRWFVGKCARCWKVRDLSATGQECVVTYKCWTDQAKRNANKKRILILIIWCSSEGGL